MSSDASRIKRASELRNKARVRVRFTYNPKRDKKKGTLYLTSELGGSLRIENEWERVDVFSLSGSVSRPRSSASAPSME
ncbi:hypothetical protein KQX54_015310 [Cotesia glomerata]|uniref:Uncharacterized protein n=1 Tax=Cotesia glomerata TaxID=32391 RepID=A0AAV7IUH0_COTGL|nr:hypothetical protein KQX54_015310 [Cotesia glomerata]